MSSTVSPAQQLPHPSRKLHKYLWELGFVHITGLKWQEPVNVQKGIVQAHRSQAGHWWFDGRYTYAIFREGGVWVSYGQPEPGSLDGICPLGKISSSIMPFGWIIHPDHLMARARNPYVRVAGSNPHLPLLEAEGEEARALA